VKPAVREAIDALTHLDGLDTASIASHVAVLVKHIDYVDTAFREIEPILTERDRAVEALHHIRAAGCGNSHVVAGDVAYGLGETSEWRPADPEATP
jgi:hypothetical protein